MEALENIESGVSRLSAARHYIEQLSRARSAPTAKQRLAALRHLFDWMVIGQIMPTNPAAAVRGPRHIVRRGKTPVLDPAEARQLLDAIDTTTVIGLRDRALIGLMVYSFARIGAAIGMRVEDVYTQNRRLWVRLHEKGGKLRAWLAEIDGLTAKQRQELEAVLAGRQPRAAVAAAIEERLGEARRCPHCSGASVGGGQADGLRRFRCKAALGVSHEALNQSNGERVRGELHIQTVNSRHESFKTFLRPHRGIATKYLAPPACTRSVRASIVCAFNAHITGLSTCGPRTKSSAVSGWQSECESAVEQIRITIE